MDKSLTINVQSVHWIPGAVPTPAPDLLTEEETARVLRLDTCKNRRDFSEPALRRAVARLRNHHGLRGIDVGGRVMYRREDVLGWLAEKAKNEPR